jgi:hypothetical protein
MGQFWDMADDLCMEKFYSDLENNVYETNEQRPASAGYHAGGNGKAV